MKPYSLTCRMKILEMVMSSGEGHIASSFSIVELLVAVYDALHQKNQSQYFTDHVLLSKGHAAYALYGMMNCVGLLTDQEIGQVGQPGSWLIGHTPVRPERGFHIGTGSLGQGLPMAVGRAFARRTQRDSVAEYVIVGDGELNEGSCWEALLMMQKFPRLKLRVLIDNNGSSTRGIPMDNVFDAIRTGWRTIDVDGHDSSTLTDILMDDDDENLIIIADTQKGYPLRRMHNNPSWHHRVPNQEEKAEMAQELVEFFGEAA